MFKMTKDRSYYRVKKGFMSIKLLLHTRDVMISIYY